MAKVEVGGSSPITLTRSRAQADLLLGLPQGGLLQARVVVVAAPARERDLAGVAAQVAAPAREHEVRLGAAGAGARGGQEQRHEHGRCDGSAPARCETAERRRGRCRGGMLRRPGERAQRAPGT